MSKVILNEGADLSAIGLIEYEWDFDEEEYQEYLEEDGLDNSQENMMEYINYNVTFEFSYYDNETFHYMQGETMSYDDIVDEYSEKIAQRVLSDCSQNGSGKMETYELYEDETYDINNPTELNAIAVKLLQHGGYYKDCRGFILTNGEVVYTPQEHNQCSIIDGVKGTFHFIKLGNIRVLQNSIDLSMPPTPEQRDVLRKVIASYSDDVLYLDIMANGTEVGCQYQHPNWRQVLAEIDRYFREGIKPQGGSNMHESKILIKEGVDENYVVCYWGCPDEVCYENSETLGVKQLYYDDYGYTFGIWDGTLVCGNDNDETSCLCHDDLIMYHIIYHGWDDIMPVKKVNEDAWDWDALCATQVDYYDSENYPYYHDEETGEILPEYQKSYGDLLKELGEPFARGRIMYDFDKGISFISFWEEPAVEEVQLIAREYGNMAKSAYWVSFNKQDDAERYFKDYKPFTLMDWLKDNTRIPKIEKDEEQFIDHLAPADKKHEQLRGWMDMHNAVMHKKLAMYDRNGKYKGDMPLAQYHSLIYQESKINQKTLKEEYHLSTDVIKETNKIFDIVFQPEMQNMITQPLNINGGFTKYIKTNQYQAIIELYNTKFTVIFNVIDYVDIDNASKETKYLGDLLNSRMDYDNKIIRICCPKYNGNYAYDTIVDSIGHEVMHIKKYMNLPKRI